MDPDFSSAYDACGFAYNSIGEFDQAIADFTELIRRFPNYPYLYNDRAWAYFYKGDYSRARADVNETLRLDPDYYRRGYNLPDRLDEKERILTNAATVKLEGVRVPV
jgi:tetratricopeptide (TPR) repeat protein